MTREQLAELVLSAPRICAHRGCEDHPTDPVAQCGVCGKVYQRCAFHGGTEGARRSLRSHRGLAHSVYR